MTNLPKDGWTTRTQRLDLKQVLCTRSFTAHGATWKTGSRNSKWISSPIAPDPLDGFNQLRLWFSTFAHLIMSTLQAEVLKGTELESASIGQIRLRLFKIAARPNERSAYPHRTLHGLSSQSAFQLGSPATPCLEQSRIIFKPDRQEKCCSQGRTQGARALSLKRATIWPSSSKKQNCEK